jgi:phage FluMu gp28-like protein
MAVEDSLRRSRNLWVFLSRSERQSLELAEKAKLWIDGLAGVAAEYFPNQPFGETSILQHEIRFPNGSRIIALPANPDTARGYTGNAVLDEFAFHKDSDAIFMAVFRQTTLGYKLRVLSTPNGQQGKFFDLARGLGLDAGIRPRKQPVRSQESEATSQKVEGQKPEARSQKSGEAPTDSRLLTSVSSSWSGHWCDIFLAVEEGLPIDPQTIRAACDEDTWLQEYCCQFISQFAEWISAELFQQCVSSDASFVLGSSSFANDKGQGTRNALYGGWDIARKRDLSVIWLSELVGDVSWTRGVIEFKGMNTVDQTREARSVLPLVRRLNIDQSGMGLAIFEQLQREFPGKVEGVQFTAPIKEQLAVLAKRRMEETKVRIPDSDSIRHSFRSVKKTVNAIGQARFDAEHDTKHGHGDHFWAFALAEAAAQQPVSSLADGYLAGAARAPEMIPMPLGVMSSEF